MLAVIVIIIKRCFIFSTSLILTGTQMVFKYKKQNYIYEIVFQQVLIFIAKTILKCNILLGFSLPQIYAVSSWSDFTYSDISFTNSQQHQYFC